MRRRIPDYFISALIGGVVGAAVVLFVTGQNPASLSLEETAHAQIERLFMPGPGVPAEVPNGKFKTLEVERLIITEQAVLNNAEGNPEVFIRDGSVLAEKVIIGQKLIGQKIQGHAIVG
ncbi:MAG: hypothetical protein FWE95_10485, partial [Planctomycetaceae bacterium]|nr:hypothetical protein [Planctomycetaceae bacterium]